MFDGNQLARRQRVLADFGEFALRSEDLDDILTEACRLVAETMGTGRAKILEIEHKGRTLLVRAGVGWQPDIVGRLRLPMEEHSSETFSIKAGRPVVTRDIGTEDRFEVPAFMREAGVVALANVPVFLPGGQAYGLLQVDATEPRDFGDEDTEFLRTYAMILGPVIDRLHKLHKLRAAEERFRLIVENARDYAIFVTDAQGRITDWLPGAEVVFGWTAEEAVGQPGSVLFTPEDRANDEDEREMEAARAAGVAPDRRWHLRKDGARVFIEGTTTVLRGDRGELRGFLKIGQDVTERRRTEERLRAGEERLAAVFEVLPVGVGVFDTHGGLILSNQEMQRFMPTGIMPSRDQARHSRWRARHPDGQPVEPQDFPGARALRGERVVPGIEMLHADDDGREVWTNASAVPLRDGDGRVTGTAVVVADVDALKRGAEALRESEERLRQFGEASSDVLWVRGADTLRWEYLSPAFEAIYGLSRERALGGDDLRHWAEFILPEDREQALRSLERVRDGKQVAFEYRIRRASDGEVRWLRDTDFPMRDGAGRVRRIGGIGQDVTDRKREAERMELLVAELQHRTRNLLAVVRNVARRSIGPSPGRDEYDARLATLGRVQGFLSRSPAYAVSLADLVRAELAAMEGGASEKVIVGGPAVELPGEGVQAVALALHELATNAVKYGALAQASGRLLITWHVESGQGGGNGGGRLVIDWRESKVAMPDGPPARRGYGSELITRALPYQLRAETALEFTHDGVQCRIVLPAGAFTRGEEAHA